MSSDGNRIQNSTGREAVLSKFRFAKSVVLCLVCLGFKVNAEKVVSAVIQPNSDDKYVNEFGLIYSSTGLIPAKLRLYCQQSVDEPDWDGVLPSDAKVCGQLDLQIRVQSVGLSLFFMNYSRNNPMSFHLHVNPDATPLRAILGVFAGAKAGFELAAGGSTMVLRNETSGVWATAVHGMVPSFASGKDVTNDFGVGLDLSVPWLEVYLKETTDLSKPIAALKGT